MPQIVTTREAAQQIGVSVRTLQRWVTDKSLPAPGIVYVGGQKFWNWKRDDLARAKAVRAKLKPGRPQTK